MTKLEQLIKELCPDGVEYKKLNKVSEMKRGTSVTKKDITEGDIPVISGGREPAYYCDTFNRDGDTITVAGSGAGAGYVQYWTSPIFVCDAFSIKGYDCIQTKYLYYCLANMQEYIYSTKKGGGVPHVHISSIENIKIPVPPIEVQREIVRILDNFTELTAELTAELIARKRQYKYYRNIVLSEPSNGRKLLLKDIANTFRGEYITKSSTKEGNIPVILGGQEPAYYIDKHNHEGEIVVVARSGASAGFVSYWNERIFITDGFGYEAKQGIVMSKYLYYILKNIEAKLNSMKRGAGVPHVSGETLSNLEFIIPSIEEQERIVAILDRFDKLCNDISEGLPAEIEGRRKQYEYYRDKLLTFKEKVN